MPTPEENKAAAREFVERVFNDHDLEYCANALADDFVEHEEAPGIETRDKAGAMQWFRQLFESIPDASAEITHVVASGDRVAIRTIMRGTDQGGFVPGMPATGKSFETTAIDIMRVDDGGKYAEHWGLFDAMTAMQQLGLVPAPPGA